MKFLIADQVVITGNDIGIVVKVWHHMSNNEYTYDVYNRMTSKIVNYKESDLCRYAIRHKYLDEEEKIYMGIYGGYHDK